MKHSDDRMPLNASHRSMLIECVKCAHRWDEVYLPIRCPNCLGVERIKVISESQEDDND